MIIQKPTHYPAKYFMSDWRLGIWGSGPFALSPDGKKVTFVCDISGRMDLWQASGGAGWPKPLTFSGNMIYDLSCSPDGKWIAYSSDREGDENYQIFLLPSEGGEPLRLTEDSLARHTLGVWSKNSETIYFTSNSRNQKYFDLYRYDLKTKKTHLLAVEDRNGLSQITALDAKGGFLFYLYSPTNSHHELWELNLKTKSKRLLFPSSSKEDVVVKSVHWIERNKTFFFRTDYQKDFTGIGCLDWKAGQFRYYHSPSREVDEIILPSDGKWIAWAENHEGYSQFSMETLSPMKKKITLPWPKNGSVVSGVVSSVFKVSKNGGFLSFLWSSPKNTSEIFRLNLKTKKIEQMTYCRAGLVPLSSFVEPTIFRYKSFDGKPISGFLFVPKNGRPPYKTIVFPHGGPESQIRASYIARAQFYAQHGWAVFAPNFRGSTGYGKKFRTLIYRDWGGGCYQDVLWGTKALIEKGIADSERLAIVGGSFGGYMVLWAICQDPRFWKAGVDIFGISNLVTLAKNDPPEWEPWIRAMIGDIEKDEEFMRSRSPIAFAHRIQCPLLVFQGAKDFRVRKEESDQIVDALCQRKIPVEYVLYSDEGHGWSKREHLLEELEKTVQFLDRHIGMAQAPQSKFRNWDVTSAKAGVQAPRIFPIVSGAGSGLPRTRE